MKPEYYVIALLLVLLGLGLLGRRLGLGLLRGAGPVLRVRGIERRREVGALHGGSLSL